ncbi:putative ATP binding protein [Corchorus olitorius]|uniref:ATP binding protein n=1 Tax=Corchorus olitorius TaxID=93759 RepID=A0A1R3KU84_9ROSI|nr:putative ATP binding protein [Corchorus olitorius]
MMGSGSHVQAIKSSRISSYTASTTDSECEEEVVSLASMVEKIMKNLRLGISQLRRSLEESRSANERLQSLTQKQAQMIEDNTLYIKELEDMDKVLTQNVEELLMEIKEIEAEVARWREACELEVEAGKKEVEERGKLVQTLFCQYELFLSNSHTKWEMIERKLGLL